MGKGTCVGRALPGIEITILPISDQIIETFDSSACLPAGEIGEIIVKGDVVTKGYENNVKENRLAKIADGSGFWHRMGDVGYLDNEGRLWFCGRRAHRVEGKEKTYYTIPCEAILNVHKDVFRSALVAVPVPSMDYSLPVLIVEPEKDSSMDSEALLAQVKELAAASELTEDIHHFLIHPDFPVDIRHNAKIFREKLSIWAMSELEGIL
jgi:acyl-CoA synthetase (AMP-forming)/AMP-acid ligase II